MTATAPYKCRQPVVDDLRLEARYLDNAELVTRFEKQCFCLAMANILQLKGFPFANRSGEIWLMEPAELYQVFKEEMEKRGLPIP